MKVLTCDICKRETHRLFQVKNVLARMFNRTILEACDKCIGRQTQVYRDTQEEYEKLLKKNLFAQFESDIIASRET